jgi:membrane protease YdiL (CAAX protease family)
MPSAHNHSSGLSKPRQGKPHIHLLAAVLGVLPLYSSLIVLQLRSYRQVPVQAFTMYLAVISPLAIVISLLLLRYLCGENPRDLNLRPGRVSWDILAALILSLIIIVANVVSMGVLSRLFEGSGSDTSVRNLFAAMAGNRWSLVLFVGPLVFLGAASEEVIRVFLLSRLWKVWPSTTGKLIAIATSACLFGLIHLYRGQATATWTAIFGLITGIYYLRFGRVVPLIMAHYFTNALYILVFAARAQ